MSEFVSAFGSRRSQYRFAESARRSAMMACCPKTCAPESPVRSAAASRDSHSAVVVQLCTTAMNGASVSTETSYEDDPFKAAGSINVARRVAVEGGVASAQSVVWPPSAKTWREWPWYSMTERYRSSSVSASSQSTKSPRRTSVDVSWRGASTAMSRSTSSVSGDLALLLVVSEGRRSRIVRWGALFAKVAANGASESRGSVAITGAASPSAYRLRPATIATRPSSSSAVGGVAAASEPTARQPNSWPAYVVIVTSRPASMVAIFAGGDGGIVGGVGTQNKSRGPSVYGFANTTSTGSWPRWRIFDALVRSIATRAKRVVSMKTRGTP
mmetsp:Transcript_1800/g.6953  ORF Transcript_1800/g.6953 Transcript_1800/m.6953 type:complete len:328 (+) Transcript_1800:575-1558(+)